MSRVEFHVQSAMPMPPERLWEVLVDWEGHGTWIPLTHSRIVMGDGGPGTEFVARSGIPPLVLTDRMRVTRLDHAAFEAEVEKLGPVLRGTAGFSIAQDATGSRVEWHEYLQVPLIPKIMAPLVSTISGWLFTWAFRRLASRVP